MYGMVILTFNPHGVLACSFKAEGKRHEKDGMGGTAKPYRRNSSTDSVHGGRGICQSGGLSFQLYLRSKRRYPNSSRPIATSWHSSHHCWQSHVDVSHSPKLHFFFPFHVYFDEFFFLFAV